MLILGICVYHGDCSATLIKDGKIVAAVEEERFQRIKHWAGFPINSIRYCLEEASENIENIDLIAVGRNPKANLKEKFAFVLKNRQSFKKLKSRFKNMKSIKGVSEILASEFKLPEHSIRKKIVNVEHHKAHMASSFMVSPFEHAAIQTIDGFGDFISAMTGIGKGNSMEVIGRVLYPHSIGLFYTLVTQFLGFMKFGDEYKVMGLAAFGEPKFKNKLNDVIKYIGNGQYRLNLAYFEHHSRGVDMTWNGGEPKMGPVYSKKFISEFGNPRAYADPITEYHRDIASSLQSITEDIIFQMLNHLHKITGEKRLCLAGGVAMNSVANGKIFDHTPFQEIYIQSAAGDAGTSLGAAYYVYNQIMQNPRNFVMETSYWGPAYSNEEIYKVIEKNDNALRSSKCLFEREDDLTNLCQKTAKQIASGKVVGWFQGRMEWGPRALGNRSIIVDPRRAEMKDVLNERIKRREGFRPFAPSVLMESTGDYFEKSYPDPFMLKVYKIRNERRKILAAVAHVDGTGRLQTVSQKENPLYYSLIKEFENITGVPVVLNTSFNENEPIVCTPQEALDCFLRTKMDLLVIGNYILSR